MSIIRHVWKAQAAAAKLRLKSTSLTVSMFSLYLTSPGQKSLLGSVTLGSQQDQADILIGASEIAAALDPANGPFNYVRFLIDVVHHRASLNVETHGWRYALIQGGAVLTNGVDQDGNALHLSNDLIDWPLAAVPFEANSGIATETIIVDVAEAL